MFLNFAAAVAPGTGADIIPFLCKNNIFNDRFDGRILTKTMPSKTISFRY